MQIDLTILESLGYSTTSSQAKKLNSKMKQAKYRLLITLTDKNKLDLIHD